MERPIVTVKQGKLQGILQENILDSYYFAFKGIPFAAPPVGKLRFQDPRSPASWDGIRDASKSAGDISVQCDLFTCTLKGSEDCLYLNVYVPYDIHGTTNNPVMIWIHGGGFFVGSGNNTKQFDYLLTKKIIIVSINYRLGVLGFLNLGHEIASGNQGIKDQLAALKWVKENIEVFGGDPENITLFGQSSGSISVHLLMLSPLSKGLFHKAILESGLGTCNWAIKETQREINSFKVASILGNDSKDSHEILEFLQTQSIDKIIKAQSQFFIAKEIYGIILPFCPVIDKERKTSLFPCSIHQLVNNDNDIPVIVGYTSHEYTLFLNDFSEDNLKMIYEYLPYYVEILIGKLKNSTKTMQLIERIKQWYFNGKPCDKNSVLSIVKCMNDILFHIPITEFVNSRRKNKKASTYFYNFSYIGSETTITQSKGYKLSIIGASHSDEMSYLFYNSKLKINDPKPPAKGTKDRKIMEALITMWTNFAKTGNPTPVLDQNVTTTWLPATADAFNYLKISDMLECIQITDYTNIFQESD